MGPAIFLASAKSPGYACPLDSRCPSHSRGIAVWSDPGREVRGSAPGTRALRSAGRTVSTRPRTTPRTQHAGGGPVGWRWCCWFARPDDSHVPGLAQRSSRDSPASRRSSDLRISIPDSGPEPARVIRTENEYPGQAAGDSRRRIGRFASSKCPWRVRFRLADAIYTPRQGFSDVVRFLHYGCSNCFARFFEDLPAHAWSPGAS